MPRYRTLANRPYTVVSGTLDSLLSPLHCARRLWGFIYLHVDRRPFEIPLHNDADGAPAFDRLRLLAIWAMAHLDGITSAKKLARFCKTVLEYRWLSGDDPPSRSLLSSFRVTFSEAYEMLRNRLTEFVQKREPTVGRELLTDGTIFSAAGSRHQMRETEKLPALIEKLERKKEEIASTGTAKRLQALQRKIEQLREALKYAKEEGLSKVCVTEPTAHLMPLKEGGFAPAYNIQWGAEGQLGLILLAEVTHNPSDGGRLKSNVEHTEQAHPSIKVSTVGADSIYHNVEELAALQRQGITTVVAERGERKAPGIADEFQAKHFTYDPERDAYVCPAGNLLDSKEKRDKEGIRYRYFGAPCSQCKFLERCCQDGKPGQRGRSIAHLTLQAEVRQNREDYESEVGQRTRTRRSILSEGVSARVKTLFGVRKLRTWETEHVESEIALIAYILNVLVIVGIWKPLVDPAHRASPQTQSSK